MACAARRRCPSGRTATAMACDVGRRCSYGRMRTAMAYGAGWVRGTRLPSVGRGDCARLPPGCWPGPVLRPVACGRRAVQGDGELPEVAVTHAGCCRSTRLHPQDGIARENGEIPSIHGEIPVFSPAVADALDTAKHELIRAGPVDVQGWWGVLLQGALSAVIGGGVAALTAWAVVSITRRNDRRAAIEKEARASAIQMLFTRPAGTQSRSAPGRQAVARTLPRSVVGAPGHLPGHLRHRRGQAPDRH